MAGVIFPKKPEISEKCQNLINKLLLKASDRITMRSIRSDPWYKKQKAKAEEILQANEKLKAEMREAEEQIISDTPISPETVDACDVKIEIGDDKEEK